MKYHRTQILLDAEEHRRLLREAAERGISLAAYVREIVASRATEPAVPYETRSWDGLFDIVSAGPDEEFADLDAEIGEAFDAEYQRDTGRTGPTRAKTPRAKTPRATGTNASRRP